MKPLNGTSHPDRNCLKYVLYFNARSLCNKLHEFQDLLASVSANRYALICVTETKFNDSTLDQAVISANPYKVFRCDRVDKIGSGCAIFLNNRLNGKQIILPSNIILSNVLAVCIEIYIQYHLYVVCRIYNPPGVSQQCMLELGNIFDFLCSKYH